MQKSYNNKKHIAVDFDGVLAKQNTDKYQRKIGEPIMPMINQVKEWLKQGHKVTIFTARASSFADNLEKMDIEIFCSKYIGQILPITAIKEHGIDLYYDDRAIRVEKNTGKILNEGSRISN